MLGADGGCDLAVYMEKFHWFTPVLNRNGFSLKLKGKLDTSCVRSCLIYGNESWMEVEHEVKLHVRNEYDQLDVWVYFERKEEQEVPLSQRDCMMLHIIENFAMSLNFIWNYTVELGICKFLLAFHCKYSSVFCNFWVIYCSRIWWPWNPGYGSLKIIGVHTVQ